MSELTAERLRSLLHYNPETGEFTWLVSRAGNAKAGYVAGFDNGDGYRKVRVDSHPYQAHRLAWLYIHGSWPNGHIDHINGNPSDNRIANLREATNSQNLQNRYRASSNSKSRLLGVSFDPKRGKWAAQIEVDGRCRFLGRYESADAAHAAYLKAKAALHPFATIAGAKA